MKASVLPDRIFVQMPEGIQIKFKLSVAGGMHPVGEGPKSEQVNTLLRSVPVRRHAFAVDRGKRRGL